MTPYEREREHRADLRAQWIANTLLYGPSVVIFAFLMQPLTFDEILAHFEQTAVHIGSVVSNLF